MRRRLKDRTVLIGGGAAGVGGAAALLYAREGANVAIGDIQEDAGEKTASEIRRGGGRALFVRTDVSSGKDVVSLVGKTVDTFGAIDILFNHAGTVAVKPFLETSDEDWRRLMDINVTSMFLMCREVLPHMLRKGRGAIVNTASVSGFTASPMESVYCVTKGAVIQLSRSIAVEFRDRGIRCNALCPGFIRTAHGLREVSELTLLGEDASDDAIRRFQGRWCDPEEVARIAVFLATDDASFVNGAAVVIDNAGTVAT